MHTLFGKLFQETRWVPTLTISGTRCAPHPAGGGYAAGLKVLSEHQIDINVRASSHKILHSVRPTFAYHISSSIAIICSRYHVTPFPYIQSLIVYTT